MIKLISKGLFCLFISFFFLYLIYSFRVEKTVNDMKQIWENNASNYVKVDNISIHYQKFGLKNDSTVIVFLPSYNFSGYIFEEMAKAISKKRTCIVIDLPNTGLSESFNSNKEKDLINYVEFLNRIMEELRLEKVYLVGQGFGSELAMSYSIYYPENVRKMALFNPLGRQEINKNTTAYYNLLNSPILGEILYNLKPNFLVKRFYQDLFYKNNGYVQEKYDRFISEFDRFGFQRRIQFILEDTLNNRVKDYSLIQVPSLLLESEKGFYYRNSKLVQYKNEASFSDTMSLKQAGQLPMITYPEKLGRIVEYYFFNEGV